VVSTRHNRVAAEGEGAIVSYDYQSQRKAALPAIVCARIKAVEAGAVQEKQNS